VPHDPAHKPGHGCHWVPRGHTLTFTSPSSPSRQFPPPVSCRRSTGHSILVPPPRTRHNKDRNGHRVAVVCTTTKPKREKARTISHWSLIKHCRHLNCRHAAVAWDRPVSTLPAHHTTSGPADQRPIEGAEPQSESARRTTAVCGRRCFHAKRFSSRVRDHQACSQEETRPPECRYPSSAAAHILFISLLDRQGSTGKNSESEYIVIINRQEEDGAEGGEFAQ
jgi:hypothetical protein